MSWLKGEGGQVFWAHGDFRMRKLVNKMIKYLKSVAHDYLFKIVKKEPEKFDAVKLACKELLDKDFYLERYPDIAAANADPLSHYIEYGFAEGRWPFSITSADAGLRIQKALEFELAKATAAGTVKQGQIAETMNNILGGNTQAAMPKQPGVPAPSPNAVPSPKAPPSPNAKQGAVPVQQALSLLEQARGTANEEKYIKFFVDTYPGVALPAWAQKK